MHDFTASATARTYPAWRLLAIFMAMNMVAYLDRSILSLAAPAIQADLALSHGRESMRQGMAEAARWSTGDHR